MSVVELDPKDALARRGMGNARRRGVYDILDNLMESAFIFLVVAAGACATIFMGLAKKLPTTVKLLKKMFPRKSPEWYVRADFVLVWLFGSMAGYILYGPRNTQQAFLAGMGFVSIIRLGIGTFESEADAREKPPLRKASGKESRPQR